MAKRKRIAVLSSQLDERYQSLFIEGFNKKAFEMDYDVCVFASYFKEPESTKKEIGETNIFSLINYDKFDAVVVMPDVLQISGLMMRIENDLSTKFKGKVLYIDRESKKYPYIMINHYSSIYRLISHLIEEHGFKDIAFVTGHKWHIHSKQRLEAFEDCMKAHGLAINENRIFYGNYWYDSGVNIVEKLLKDKEKLPEAFACANDYMAIGLAETLVKNGIRVPEDVAVIGYDSVKQGKMCPHPITSVPLPCREFGNHAAVCIDALLRNMEFPEFVNNSPIFIGESCGCHPIKEEHDDLKSQDWNIIEKGKSFYNSFNRLTEDLVLQSSFKGLIDMIQTYSYQIREFEIFAICLNDVWVNGNQIKDTIIKEGYTKQMAPVLQCGISGKGADKIDYDERFDTSLMYPDLYEESEYPRSFIFSPLNFDDITFGYSVLSFGNSAESYSESYSMWCRSVMTGIECYRRNAMLIEAKEEAEEIQIYDSLTGMFNYEGFVKHAKPMIDRGISIRNYITVLAMDLEGLEKINSSFGRKEGDQAIRDLSKIVFECADEGAMCCRLGNDELIVAELTPEATPKTIMNIQNRIGEAIDKLNNDPNRKYKLKMYFGNSTDKVENLARMEDLVNLAVSAKNGNKASQMRMMNSNKLTPEEQEQAGIVKKILDENRFFYNFQPIVSAADGSIFAYEALMRAKIEPFISPLDIIKYATHLDRLIDIEKATFFNVLDFVRTNSSDFEGRKVFINSIPGNTLKGEDAKQLTNLLIERRGQIVVEMTEQSEADDDELENLKERYADMGVELAVDDYGTGYSNIVNLLRYTPDYVKIDRMLLTGIQNNPQKQHFVKDIVLFAHDNHFKVLAEGIETTEELQTVIHLGVDLIQGYYTAKPSPVVIRNIPENICGEILKFNSEK